MLDGTDKLPTDQIFSAMVMDILKTIGAVLIGVIIKTLRKLLCPKLSEIDERNKSKKKNHRVIIPDDDLFEE